MTDDATTVQLTLPKFPLALRDRLDAEADRRVIGRRRLIEAILDAWISEHAGRPLLPDGRLPEPTPPTSLHEPAPPSLRRYLKQYPPVGTPLPGGAHASWIVTSDPDGSSSVAECFCGWVGSPHTDESAAHAEARDHAAADHP